MTKRLEFIDIAKGFAILFVLLIHRWPIPVFGRIIGSFYMPLFFFVSGYTSREGGGYKYCIHKSKSIFLKYLKYSIVLVLIYVIISILNGTFPENIRNNLLGIVYSRSYLFPSTSDYNIQLMDMEDICNAPLWFLTAYISTICVFNFTRYLINRKRVKVGLVITLLLALTVGLSFVPVLLPWSIDTCFLCALFMWAGKLTASNFGRSDVERRHIKWVFLLLIVFLFTAVYNGNCNLSIRYYGSHSVLSVLLFTVTGIVGSGLFVFLCKLLERYRVMKIFQIIGRHTVFLLGFHLLLYKGFDCLISFFEIDSSNWYVAHVADIIVVIITVGVLIFLDCIFQKVYSRSRGANFLK